MSKTKGRSLLVFVLSILMAFSVALGVAPQVRAFAAGSERAVPETYAAVIRLTDDPKTAVEEPDAGDSEKSAVTTIYIKEGGEIDFTLPSAPVAPGPEARAASNFVDNNGEEIASLAEYVGRFSLINVTGAGVTFKGDIKNAAQLSYVLIGDAGAYDSLVKLTDLNTATVKYALTTAVYEAKKDDVNFAKLGIEDELTNLEHSYILSLRELLATLQEQNDYTAENLTVLKSTELQGETNITAQKNSTLDGESAKKTNMLNAYNTAKESMENVDTWADMLEAARQAVKDDAFSNSFDPDSALVQDVLNEYLPEDLALSTAADLNNRKNEARRAILNAAQQGASDWVAKVNELKEAVSSSEMTLAQYKEIVALQYTYEKELRTTDKEKTEVVAAKNDYDQLLTYKGEVDSAVKTAIASLKSGTFMSTYVVAAAESKTVIGWANYEAAEESRSADAKTLMTALGLDDLDLPAIDALKEDKLDKPGIEPAQVDNTAKGYSFYLIATTEPEVLAGSDYETVQTYLALKARVDAFIAMYDKYISVFENESETLFGDIDTEKTGHINNASAAEERKAALEGKTEFLSAVETFKNEAKTNADLAAYPVDDLLASPAENIKTFENLLDQYVADINKLVTVKFTFTLNGNALETLPEDLFAAEGGELKFAVGETASVEGVAQYSDFHAEEGEGVIILVDEANKLTATFKLGAGYEFESVSGGTKTDAEGAIKITGTENEITVALKSKEYSAKVKISDEAGMAEAEAKVADPAPHHGDALLTYAYSLLENNQIITKLEYAFKDSDPEVEPESYTVFDGAGAETVIINKDSLWLKITTVEVSDITAEKVGKLTLGYKDKEHTQGVNFDVASAAGASTDRNYLIKTFNVTYNDVVRNITDFSDTTKQVQLSLNVADAAYTGATHYVVKDLKSDLFGEGKTYEDINDYFVKLLGTGKYDSTSYSGAKEIATAYDFDVRDASGNVNTGTHYYVFFFYSDATGAANAFKGIYTVQVNFPEEYEEITVTFDAANADATKTDIKVLKGNALKDSAAFKALEEGVTLPTDNDKIFDAYYQYTAKVDAVPGKSEEIPEKWGAKLSENDVITEAVTYKAKYYEGAKEATWSVNDEEADAYPVDIKNDADVKKDYITDVTYTDIVPLTESGDKDFKELKGVLDITAADLKKTDANATVKVEVSVDGAAFTDVETGKESGIRYTFVRNTVEESADLDDGAKLTLYVPLTEKGGMYKFRITLTIPVADSDPTVKTFTVALNVTEYVEFLVTIDNVGDEGKSETVRVLEGKSLDDSADWKEYLRDTAPGTISEDGSKVFLGYFTETAAAVPGGFLAPLAAGVATDTLIKATEIKTATNIYEKWFEITDFAQGELSKPADDGLSMLDNVSLAMTTPLPGAVEVKDGKITVNYSGIVPAGTSNVSSVKGNDMFYEFNDQNTYFGVAVKNFSDDDKNKEGAKYAMLSFDEKATVATNPKKKTFTGKEETVNTFFAITKKIAAETGDTYKVLADQDGAPVLVYFYNDGGDLVAVKRYTPTFGSYNVSTVKFISYKENDTTFEANAPKNIQFLNGATITDILSTEIGHNEHAIGSTMTDGGVTYYFAGYLAYTTDAEGQKEIIGYYDFEDALFDGEETSYDITLEEMWIPEEHDAEDDDRTDEEMPVEVPVPGVKVTVDGTGNVTIEYDGFVDFADALDRQSTTNPNAAGKDKTTVYVPFLVNFPAGVTQITMDGKLGDRDVTPFAPSFIDEDGVRYYEYVGIAKFTDGKWTWVDKFASGVDVTYYGYDAEGNLISVQKVKVTFAYSDYEEYLKTQLDTLFKAYAGETGALATVDISDDVKYEVLVKDIVNAADALTAFLVKDADGNYKADAYLSTGSKVADIIKADLKNDGSEVDVSDRVLASVKLIDKYLGEESFAKYEDKLMAEFFGDFTSTDVSAAQINELNKKIVEVIGKLINGYIMTDNLDDIAEGSNTFDGLLNEIVDSVIVGEAYMFAYENVYTTYKNAYGEDFKGTSEDADGGADPDFSDTKTWIDSYLQTITKDPEKSGYMDKVDAYIDALVDASKDDVATEKAAIDTQKTMMETSWTTGDIDTDIWMTKTDAETGIQSAMLAALDALYAEYEANKYDYSSAQWQTLTNDYNFYKGEIAKAERKTDVEGVKELFEQARTKLSETPDLWTELQEYISDEIGKLDHDAETGEAPVNKNSYKIIIDALGTFAFTAISGDNTVVVEPGTKAFTNFPAGANAYTGWKARVDALTKIGYQLIRLDRIANDTKQEIITYLIQKGFAFTVSTSNIDDAEAIDKIIGALDEKYGEIKYGTVTERSLNETLNDYLTVIYYLQLWTVAPADLGLNNNDNFKKANIADFAAKIRELLDQDPETGLPKYPEAPVGEEAILAALGRAETTANSYWGMLGTIASEFKKAVDDYSDALIEAFKANVQEAMNKLGLTAENIGGLVKKGDGTYTDTALQEAVLDKFDYNVVLTLDSAAQIYDMLSNYQKAQQDITAHKNYYDLMMNVYRDFWEPVQEVIDMVVGNANKKIDPLAMLATLTTRENVEAAREAYDKIVAKYNALTDKQKAAVNGYLTDNFEFAKENDLNNYVEDYGTLLTEIENLFDLVAVFDDRFEDTALDKTADITGDDVTFDSFRTSMRGDFDTAYTGKFVELGKTAAATEKTLATGFGLTDFEEVLATAKFRREHTYAIDMKAVIADAAKAIKSGEAQKLTESDITLELYIAAKDGTLGDALVALDGTTGVGKIAEYFADTSAEGSKFVIKVKIADTKNTEFRIESIMNGETALVENVTSGAAVNYDNTKFGADYNKTDITAIVVADNTAKTGADATIVATIDLKNFEIKFTHNIPKAGTTEVTPTDMPSNRGVRYGKTLEAVSEPSYAGYTFDGWRLTTEDGNKFKFAAEEGANTITADTTLVARFVKDSWFEQSDFDVQKYENKDAEGNVIDKSFETWEPVLENTMDAAGSQITAQTLRIKYTDIVNWSEQIQTGGDRLYAGIKIYLPTIAGKEIKSVGTAWWTNEISYTNIYTEEGTDKQYIVQYFNVAKKDANGIYQPIMNCSTDLRVRFYDGEPTGAGDERTFSGNLIASRKVLVVLDNYEEIIVSFENKFADTIGVDVDGVTVPAAANKVDFVVLKGNKLDKMWFKSAPDTTTHKYTTTKVTVTEATELNASKVTVTGAETTYTADGKTYTFDFYRAADHAKASETFVTPKAEGAAKDNTGIIEPVTFTASWIEHTAIKSNNVAQLTKAEDGSAYDPQVIYGVDDLTVDDTGVIHVNFYDVVDWEEALTEQADYNLANNLVYKGIKVLYDGVAKSSNEYKADGTGADTAAGAEAETPYERLFISVAEKTGAVWADRKTERTDKTYKLYLYGEKGELLTVFTYSIDTEEYKEVTVTVKTEIVGDASDAPDDATVKVLKGNKLSGTMNVDDTKGFDAYEAYEMFNVNGKHYKLEAKKFVEDPDGEYIFAGWFTDAAAAGAPATKVVYDITSVVNADTTIYARFIKIAKATITANKNNPENVKVTATNENVTVSFDSVVNWVAAKKRETNSFANTVFVGFNVNMPVGAKYVNLDQLLESADAKNDKYAIYGKEEYTTTEPVYEPLAVLADGLDNTNDNWAAGVQSGKSDHVIYFYDENGGLIGAYSFSLTINPYSVVDIAVVDGEETTNYKGIAGNKIESALEEGYLADDYDPYTAAAAAKKHSIKDELAKGGKYAYERYTLVEEKGVFDGFRTEKGKVVNLATDEISEDNMTLTAKWVQVEETVPTEELTVSAVDWDETNNDKAELVKAAFNEEGAIDFRYVDIIKWASLKADAEGNVYATVIVTDRKGNKGEAKLQVANTVKTVITPLAAGTVQDVLFNVLDKDGNIVKAYQIDINRGAYEEITVKLVDGETTAEIDMVNGSTLAETSKFAEATYKAFNYERGVVSDAGRADKKNFFDGFRMENDNTVYTIHSELTATGAKPETGNRTITLTSVWTNAKAATQIQILEEGNVFFDLLNKKIGSGKVELTYKDLIDWDNMAVPPTGGDPDVIYYGIRAILPTFTGKEIDSIQVGYIYLSTDTEYAYNNEIIVDLENGKRAVDLWIPIAKKVDGAVRPMDVVNPARFAAGINGLYDRTFNYVFYDVNGNPIEAMTLQFTIEKYSKFVNQYIIDNFADADKLTVEDIETWSDEKIAEAELIIDQLEYLDEVEDAQREAMLGLLEVFRANYLAKLDELYNGIKDEKYAELSTNDQHLFDLLYKQAKSDIENAETLSEVKNAYDKAEDDLTNFTSSDVPSTDLKDAIEKAIEEDIVIPYYTDEEGNKYELFPDEFRMLVAVYRTMAKIADSEADLATIVDDYRAEVIKILIEKLNAALTDDSIKLGVPAEFALEGEDLTTFEATLNAAWTAYTDAREALEGTYSGDDFEAKDWAGKYADVAGAWQSLKTAENTYYDAVSEAYKAEAVKELDAAIKAVEALNGEGADTTDYVVADELTAVVEKLNTAKTNISAVTTLDEMLEELAEFAEAKAAADEYIANVNELKAVYEEFEAKIDELVSTIAGKYSEHEFVTDVANAAKEAIKAIKDEADTPIEDKLDAMQAAIDQLASDLRIAVAYAKVEEKVNSLTSEVGLSAINMLALQEEAPSLTDSLKAKLNTKIESLGLDADYETQAKEQLNATLDNIESLIASDDPNFDIKLDVEILNFGFELNSILLRQVNAQITAIDEAIGGNPDALKQLLEGNFADAALANFKTALDNAINTALATLIGRMDAAESNIDRLTGDLDELSETVDAIKAITDLLNKDGDKTGIYDALQDILTAIDNLQTTLDSKADAGTIQAALDTLTNRLNKFNNGDQTIEAVVAGVLDNINDIQNEIRGYKTDIEELKAELARVEREYKAADEDMKDALADEIDKLTSEIDKKENALYSKIEQEVNALKALLNSNVADTNKNIEDTNNKLNSLKSTDWVKWLTLILVLVLIVLLVLILIFMRRNGGNNGNDNNDKNDDTPQEPDEPQAPEEEETPQTDEVQDNVQNDEIVSIEEPNDLPNDDLAGKKKIRTFDEILHEAPDSTKMYYSLLKNKLTSYRKVKGKMSKRNESFRHGRVLVAKMGFSGKNLKLYLALDPDQYDNNVYPHKNVGDKKKYAEVPMLVKVKSNRMLNRAETLISEMMEKNGFLPRRSIDNVDYVKQLMDPQNTPLGKSGYADLLCDEADLEKTKAFPDKDAEKAIIVQPYTPDEGDPIRLNLAVGDINANFPSGATVDLKELKRARLAAKSVNYVKVTADGAVTKPLNIVANSFALDAAKMIMLTGGKAIRLKAEKTNK